MLNDVQSNNYYEYGSGEQYEGGEQYMGVNINPVNQNARRENKSKNKRWSVIYHHFKDITNKKLLLSNIYFIKLWNLLPTITDILPHMKKMKMMSKYESSLISSKNYLILIS